MSNNSKPTSFFAKHKHNDTKKVESDEIDESTSALLREAAKREANGDLAGSLDAYRESLKCLIQQVGKNHPLVAETFEKVAHVMIKLELDGPAKRARENANDIYHKLFDSLSRQGKMTDAYIYFSRSKKIEDLLEESSRPPSNVIVSPATMERISVLRSSTLDSSSNHNLPPKPPLSKKAPQTRLSSFIRPGIASRNTSTNTRDSSRSLSSIGTLTSMSGLRPETQKFITTLNGYLDCRRKMDTKYQELDKATLLAKLKLETHSHGIELASERDEFKESYRQQSITHEGPVQDIDDLYAAAKAAQPIFMEKIKFLVSQVCGDCDVNEADVKVYFADLKQQDRALEKAHDDYDHRSPGPGVSWLYDIVRGSVEFNSASHIESFIRHLYEENDIHIVKAKNRFEKPSLTGYRDMCVQFRLDSEKGHSHICEVQIHHKVILALDKAIGSHAFYEFFRSYFSGAVGSLQERLKDLELISDGALVDESFLDNFLTKCSFKDADRLERLAKLFDKNLCEYDAAIQIYERLAEVLAEKHGPANYFVAGTYATIAAIMDTKGMSDEALELYDKSARLCSKSLGPLHPAIASMLNNMASVLASQDRFDEGYATYGNAAKIYKFHLGNPNSTFDPDQLKKSLAGAYHNMAGILFDQGKLDESLKLHREALDMKIELLTETNESVGLSYNSIGDVLEAQDKHDEAMAHFETSLDIYKRTLGHSHSSVASCLQSIAQLLQVQDKYDQALDMFKMVLAIKKKNYGEEHTSVAHTYLAIAAIKIDQSKHDDAIELCNKALEIKKATVGEDHSSVSVVYITLAKIYYSQGKLNEAMDMMQWKALKITTNALGREDRSLIEIYSIMAYILHEQEQYEEALARFKQALDIATKIFGEEHSNVASIYAGMGTTLKDQGKFERAMEMYQQSLEIDRKAFGDDHSTVVIDYARIANLMAKQGDVDGAMETFKRVLDWHEKRPEVDIYSEVSALINIGRMYSFIDKLDEAMEYLQRALDICNKSGLQDKYITSTVHGNIGTIFKYQGKMDQAMEAYQHSMSINRNIHGEDHLSIASLRTNIAIILVGRGDIEGATANFDRAVGFYEERPSEHTLTFIATLHDVGDMYRGLEQLETAMDYCQRALNTCQDAGFQDLLIAASAHAEIGNTLMLQGKMEEALEKHRESLVIKQKIHGEDHLCIMTEYCSIASVMVEQENFDGAMENFQRSLDWFAERPGQHTIAFVRTFCLVGRMNIRQEKYDKSIECCRRALDICAENGIEDLYIAGTVHSLLGWAQKLHGNLLEESRKSYRAALRIYRDIYGQDHLALGGVYNDIGEVLILQEDFKKAKKYLEKAKEIYASRVGDDTALVAEVTLNFGILKHKEGEEQEALDFLHSAQKIFNDTAHTWRQKDLRKKTKRTIVAIKKGLGTKKKKKKSSSKGGGGWKKVI